MRAEVGGMRPQPRTPEAPRSWECRKRPSFAPEEAWPCVSLMRDCWPQSEGQMFVVLTRPACGMRYGHGTLTRPSSRPLLCGMFGMPSMLRGRGCLLAPSLRVPRFCRVPDRGQAALSLGSTLQGSSCCMLGSPPPHPRHEFPAQCCGPPLGLPGRAPSGAAPAGPVSPTWPFAPFPQTSCPLGYAPEVHYFSHEK